MRHWRKVLMVGMAWLAAVMTTVSTTPHVICRCVDGSIRIPGLLASGQPCCARKLAANAERKPICPHCRVHSAKTSTAELTSPCCHQTAAQPLVFWSPHSRRVLDQPAVIDTLPAADAIALLSLGQANGNDAVPEPDQQSPPPDRVIALQHFLI